VKPAYKPMPHSEKVTWLDHFGSDTRMALSASEIAERVKEDAVCVTVGFVAYEDDRLVALAFEARVDVDYKEADFINYLAVYKVSILERIILKEAK